MGIDAGSWEDGNCLLLYMGRDLVQYLIKKAFDKSGDWLEMAGGWGGQNKVSPK